LPFHYRNGVLCADEVALDEIARRHGTPCFVYSQRSIESAYAQFAGALAGRDSLICYSVKANSNLAVLALLARLGAGFDIVSGGELARVLAAGGDPRRTLFSGVGKSAAEIRYALEQDIGCINLESEGELERVAAIAAKLGKRAPIAFRVNPDIDAKTHPYISTGLRETKFGVPHADAERLYRKAAGLKEVEVVGIGCHIGSLLLDPAPLVAAVERLMALIERIGVPLRHLDVGGGYGIRYKDESPQPIAAFMSAVLAAVGERRETIVVDPGRSIVGNAGLLLTRVEYVKPGYLVVDAAMNDLIRPALYGAWHDVKTVKESAPGDAVYNVVGPVCESADFLAKERRLAAAPGELLAIMSCGAYAMAMSSNYNSRPRAAEVLVSGGSAHLVRRRESADELFALERLPPDNRASP
jgi:diaminopimelate decarboxylase